MIKIAKYRVSKYRKCPDCSGTFRINKILAHRLKFEMLKIYCPYCNGENSYNIQLSELSHSQREKINDYK